MTRLLSFLLLAFSAFTVVAATPVSAAPQSTYLEFKERFEKALNVGAKDELKRLFGGNEVWAIDMVVETAEAVGSSPNERLQLRWEAIVETWTATKTGDFVRNMERYFAYLDPPTQRERFRIKSQYNKATNLFVEAEAAKDRGKLNALAEQFQAYAEAFEQCGEKYLAGNAWLFRSFCMDERHIGADADMRAVAAAYRKLIDLRLEIDLKDRFYRETLPILERLEGLGFGAPKGGDGGGGAAAGAVATVAGPTVTAVTSFEVLTTVEFGERPNYFLDEHYSVWDSLRFGRVGSAATLTRVAGSPTFLRAGSTKIEIDTDGDGKGDVEMPARGRLEPVEIEVGTGATKRKWAFLAQAGNQTDQYQGIELSNAASDDNWGIFLAPGASVVADIAGTRLQVFDDNLDGICGSAPADYGHVGLTKGLFQPEFDTMLVGDAKRAGPWSEYARFPSGWMKLENQGDGARIAATPIEMRTGKLKLAAKGLTPEFLIVKGMNDFEHSYFDLTSAKEVEVPVGRYRVYWGLVAKGSKKQLIKALVLPSESAKTYEVMEGQTVSVAFGAPFDFDFEKQVHDETIDIDGNSVTVIGAGGERYERIYGAVPKPDASYRKKGSKRGSKPEEMDVVSDRDGFDRKGGYPALWKPQNLVLEKKASEEDVEVQLSEKKNKLFGKIDGSWR